MKQTWVTPRVNIQNFEANEYVAACWDAACGTGILGENMRYGHPDEHIIMGNPDSTNNNHGKAVSGTGCGWAVNQYITGIGSGPFTMKEVNISGQNDLECRLYTDTTYTTPIQSLSNLQEGQTIYWTTSNTEYTWYHYGTVNLQNTTHPNRS